MSQNQQLGQIATQTAFKARSRFNLDHDYNTTLTFGETQPSFIREMIPGSKLEVKTNSLVRLPPMLAPTFGRMKIENRSHFIPISSLVKHFQDIPAKASQLYMWEGFDFEGFWTFGNDCLSKKGILKMFDK